MHGTPEKRMIIDHKRRTAVAEASRILQGLGAEITMKLLSARAARILKESPTVMHAYMQRYMTVEERAALGIKSCGKRTTTSEASYRLQRPV